MASASPKNITHKTYIRESKVGLNSKNRMKRERNLKAEIIALRKRYILTKNEFK